MTPELRGYCREGVLQPAALLQSPLEFLEPPFLPAYGFLDPPGEVRVEVS